MMDKQMAIPFFPMVHNILSGNIPATGNAPFGSLHNCEVDFYLNDGGKIDKLNHSRFFSKEDKKVNTTNIYDVAWFPEDIPENTLFVLNIDGPVTKHDQYCGPVGMATKAQWLKMADAHPHIVGHVLKIDSGGGEGYATRMFNGIVSSLKKHVFSFVEGFAASAAYWIASNTDLVVASNDMDRVGSIGTYVTIADYRRYYKEEMKIDLQDVYAEKSKNKNRDYLDAIDGNTEKIQKVVNQYNDFFLKEVRKTRKGKLDINSDWDTGEMYFAQEAVDNGLIDGIMTFDEYLLNIYKNLI